MSGPGFYHYSRKRINLILVHMVTPHFVSCNCYFFYIKKLTTTHSKPSADSAEPESFGKSKKKGIGIDTLRAAPRASVQACWRAKHGARAGVCAYARPSEAECGLRCLARQATAPAAQRHAPAPCAPQSGEQVARPAVPLPLLPLRAAGQARAVSQWA